MGCMYEFMEDLELCDESNEKFVDENIIGCKLKAYRSKENIKDNRKEKKKKKEIGTL